MTRWHGANSIYDIIEYFALGLRLRLAASGCLLMFLSIHFAFAATDVNDVSRLNPVTVSKLFKIASLDDIMDAVAYARNHHLPIAIAGKRHSQGGHTAVAGGVVLDMSDYNKISWLSEQDKTLMVQSGATWAQIQHFINPNKLALSVMQSANIFSVGGSLGANIHGRDPRWGPIADSVVSFHLVLADGDEVEVSRSHNYRLFRAVLGGYGLLGVITEVTLKLSDNAWLNKIVTRLRYDEYIDHLATVLSDKLALHYGRCSIAINDDFFRDCIAVDYYQLQRGASDSPLKDEQHVARNRYFFDLSRKYQWAKSLRWWLQGQLLDKPGETQDITRNNAMRPPIAFLSYYSDSDTDILQEYFVPLKNFNSFMDELRQILLQNQVNVLSMTLRYLKQNDVSYLNYAEHDAIAIVLYINVGMDESAQQHAQSWTRLIVDSVLNYNGSYYLTYQSYPSLAQFRRAYPEWRKFQRLKKRYDPDQLFQNGFYRKYFPQ